MDRRQIQRVLIEVLNQIQTDGGHPLVDMNEDTCPLDEIPGFDSLTAIEATIELASRLGHEIPRENIFVNNEGKRILCIREISEQLHKMLNPEVGSHD
jgi:acyl carrier protein